jgi:UDP-3-O-[3-hydroxymyristoyl] N-acetylglucosamine deacetylase
VEQSTIARRVTIAGNGLHGGGHAHLVFDPAPADTGLVFVREGGDGGDVEIPVGVASLASGTRATTLAPGDDELAAGQGGLRIRTVEHLLACVAALEIDNLRIRVEGDEIPAFDGSAAPLFQALDSAGRVVQARPRRCYRLRSTIELRDGDRFIRAEPGVGLRIAYAIDFSHPLIGRQRFELPRLDRDAFERELARARTFGFLHELDSLRSAGLAEGGGLDNAIVLDDRRILNAEGLRFPDEFVRHKVVDLIGDLALLGARLEAHVTVERGGHSLHHQLVRALAARWRDEVGEAAASGGRSPDWPVANAVGRARRDPA